MAKSEPHTSSPPLREDQEPAYEGERGRTQLRSVHVTLPSGFVRLVQVYSSVNVSTDPHLREPALAGALHRFETGDVLAIPFVYHDPMAHKFALVVPTELRHEQLQLRAKLLQQIADDDESPIPFYVAEAKTVVGIPALKIYLAEQDTRAAQSELDRRESALAAREQRLRGLEIALAGRQGEIDTQIADTRIQSDALGQREARLLGRAEEVTRREDELRSWAEELEAARADVRMQEQELNARIEVLSEREAEVAKAAQSPPAQSPTVSSPTANVAPIGRVSPLGRSTPIAMIASLDSVPPAPIPRVGEDDVVQLIDDEVEEMRDGDDDVQELNDLEPLETNPAAVQDDLADSVPMVAEPLSAPGDVEAIEDIDELVDAEAIEDIEELVDADDMEIEDLADDDVEELVELEPIEDVTGVHTAPTPEPLETSNTVIATPEAPPGPQPTVPPPPSFLDRPHAAATLDEGRVRIFAKLPAGKDNAFTNGDAELLVQLLVIEERPVVLLTTAERDRRRPCVVRAPIDPRGSEGKELLEKLRRECTARVALFTTDGQYLRTVEASGPREVNVLRIIERVSKMRTAAAVNINTAIERAIATPPPIADTDHPFVADASLKDAKNAAAALRARDELERWSSHDRMDRALLGLSIPAKNVDSTIRHTLAQAVSYGLPLSPRLRDHALAHDVAANPVALVTAQVEGLTKTTRRVDRGGLTAVQAADAWEALLRAAAEVEVAIDTKTHEHAWAVIRRVRGGDAKKVDPAKFPDLDKDELVLLLEHPKYREAAATELASRKDPELVEQLCKAVRKMPRAEVVRVVPKILAIGDEAGDALIDGLSARKTFVRQAFALSLGHLKLRRAVVPLLHLLASEQSEVWREVARVLGGFGTASHRTISRQLKDPKGPKERYVVTLAHLANHGCEKQVDKLSRDDRPSVAGMAVEALTMRQDASTTEDRARGEKKLPKRDAVLEFSRRFYAELGGRGSEDDLADAPSPN